MQNRATYDSSNILNYFNIFASLSHGTTHPYQVLVISLLRPRQYILPYYPTEHIAIHFDVPFDHTSRMDQHHFATPNKLYLRMR